MREKLIELLRNAKAAMKAENLSCDIAKNMFVVEFMMANGVTVQQWIPVSERLPELDVDVLAFNGDYIFVSQYYRSHWGSWDKVGHLVWVKDQYAKNPTHWMPLPPAPKGESL